MRAMSDATAGAVAIAVLTPAVLTTGLVVPLAGCTAFDQNDSALSMLDPVSASAGSATLADQRRVRGLGGPAELTSGLGIPAGEQFHLGGGQDGGYRVSLENKGPVAVIVRVVPGKTMLAGGERGSATGAPLDMLTINPGDEGVYRFEPGEQLLLTNTSDTRNASLRVRVRGDTNLAMFYTPKDDG